jgi:hypothetical protein
LLATHQSRYSGAQTSSCEVTRPPHTVTCFFQQAPCLPWPVWSQRRNFSARLRKRRSIRLYRKVAVRPITQLLSAISVHCGNGSLLSANDSSRSSLVRGSSRSQHVQRSSCSRTQRWVSRSGYATEHETPRESTTAFYRRGGQAFHIWHAILGNGTDSRPCEDRVPWHRDQGCGDELVNSWRDHYDRCLLHADSDIIGASQKKISK